MVHGTLYSISDFHIHQPTNIQPVKCTYRKKVYYWRSSFSIDLQSCLCSNTKNEKINYMQMWLQEIYLHLSPNSMSWWVRNLGKIRGKAWRISGITGTCTYIPQVEGIVNLAKLALRSGQMGKRLRGNQELEQMSS